MSKPRAVSVLVTLIAVLSVASGEQPRYVTVVKPIRVKVPYGETQIPAGTRLDVISSDATTVRVTYMGAVQILPKEAVVMPEAESSQAPHADVKQLASAKSSPPANAEQKPTTKDIESTSYVVKTDKGQGSAFLVRMANKSYLVTNYHVLCGARTAQFISSGGSITLEAPWPLEVANDRDLVRIPVNIPAVLGTAESASIKDSIEVYSNPGGQEVVTMEAGKVLGISPGEVEVSAKFIPGSSGGPIVQATSGKVIGVATYLRRNNDIAKWITDKTRFEEARRFGVRLDESVTWSSTTWSSFAADTALVTALDDLLNESGSLVRLLASNPYRKRISSNLAPPSELARLRCWQRYQGIVRAYNGSCDEYARTLSAPVYDANEVGRSNSFFEGRIRGQATNLGECLQEASLDFGRINHRFADKHSADEYKTLVKDSGDFGGLLKTHAQDIANKNMFQLSP